MRKKHLHANNKMIDLDPCICKRSIRPSVRSSVCLLVNELNNHIVSTFKLLIFKAKDKNMCFMMHEI